MSPPLISDYKKSFVLKRVIQTFLGGPRLFSPPIFIVIQITIFTIPAIIVSLVNLDQKEFDLKWKSIATGCSVFLVDLCLSLVILLLKRESAFVTPIISIDAPSINGENCDNDGGERGPRIDGESRFAQEASFLSEEDVIVGGGFLKASTWNYIAPNISLGLIYISALALSSFAFGVCTPFMISETTSPVLRGFVILALCISRYSSVICSPPEVATFDATDRKHLLYRSFYAAFTGGIYVFVTQISEDVDTYDTLLSFSIICACLPILWVVGTLPPLDALFPWILETILQVTGGSSPSYYYLGTLISLTIVILCPIVVFIISQESLVIILAECFCGYIISCDLGRVVSLKAALCEDTPTKSFLHQLVHPLLIILTSLLCVLIAWLNLAQVSTFEYEISFAAVTLTLTISLWIFRHLTIANKNTSQVKAILVPLYILHGLLTFLLHIWLTFSIEHENNEWSSIRTSVSHRIKRLVPYLLTIRAFALAISEPRKSTIDFTLTFLWRRYLAEPKSSFILILLINSLITSRIKRLLKHFKTICSVVYAVGISTILHSKLCVAASALAFSPISLWSLFLATMVEGATLTPIFTLPIFILGFPRPSSFWNTRWFPKRNKTRNLDIETTDWKIYSEIGPLLACGISRTAYLAKLKIQQGECFLARYEDRLLFIRIVSSGWNFAYLQIIGLEMQEQTSCHHQEAVKIDEIFERMFGESDAFLKTCVNPLSLPILTPNFSLKLPTYSESKSNISSLSSSTDKATFKDMFYRSFSYLWIKNNPALKGESYQREITRKISHNQSMRFSTSNGNGNNGLMDALPAIDSVEKNSITNLQPFSMNNALFRCTLSTVNFIQSDQLAPSTVLSEHIALPNGISDVVRSNSIDEEETLEPRTLSRRSTRSTLVSPTEKNQLLMSTIEDVAEINNGTEFSSSDKLSSIWVKQCVGDVIPSNAVKARVEKICRAVWDTIIGTDDEKEIDLSAFFQEDFQTKLKSLSTSRKVDMEEITLKAFRYATKLTLDEMFTSESFASNSKVIVLNAESEEEIFTQLTLYERDYQFCSPMEIPMWISQNTNHIITIARNEEQKFHNHHQQSGGGGKSVMRMFHYEPEGVEFRIGQLDQFTVEGIWSNLNLELLYFTSDDDERFSIQNDRILLRNIITQCAKSPLGYPVYDAVFRVNLHNFTTTQIE